MKISDFSRYVLCSCVATAMLAGCGGSQPPIGAPGAMPLLRAIQLDECVDTASETGHAELGIQGYGCAALCN